MAWRISAGKTQGPEYSWWLYAGNGEQVAWAGETFPSQHNAGRAAAAFKIGSATARYEVFADAAGEYRWRAWRGSEKVAASGEAFASKYNAERAAETVRLNAWAAEGP
ncbi:hypothetical protein GCM10010196_02570 [Agromyces mediolanus]|uniref:DUF1508 domain-containing protein n=1 Tax=Agromyces mediolanus TaxID=41986 RepID=A0A918CBA8_AGRME|nr:hypothetical protein GCM10010196_02570 [Agromyces mediolanus]GLJ72661.1 hypothetical protein GCM10017583_19170 [Agromyces mediolanus]